MNRTIKFRGIRPITSEWVYGYFVKLPIWQCRIYCQPFEGATLNTWYDVIPESIGQFTGIFDRNGKESFEFDLIRPPANYFYPGEFEEMMVIREWNGCAIALNTHDGYGKRSDDLNHMISDDTTNWCYLHEFHENFEIIGNIHQNPELL